MDVEAAFRKVFAKLDEMNSRIDKMDPNGKLDELKEEMRKVSADSRVMVSTVLSHGDSIGKLERSIERLLLTCPAAVDVLAEEHKEDQAGNGQERLRPSSSEYEALQRATEEDED